MQKLNIETFPLSGTRLIEASAGTGKTYTISGLYLRLLLEEKLDVTQILVVTFTDAATQELRGRIRQRIYDALRWLEGKKDEDDFADMLAPYKDDREVIQRLRDAVTRMDEAAVFTIHGFCQRTLTDSAFESGVLFDAEFITDESEIRQQIARDFWRRRVVESESGEVAWIVERWRTPSSLLKDISALVDDPQITVVPEVTSSSIPTLMAGRAELYEEFSKQWPVVQEEVSSLLLDSKLLGRAKETFKKDNLEALFGLIPQFISSDSAPSTLPGFFELLTYSKINAPSSHKPGEIKKGTPPPSHPFFELADELGSCYKKLDGAREVLFMTEAAEYMRTEIDRRKEKSRIMFFDDLLTKLDNALMGEGGGVLAARIREQYRVGMIDEFQDTDPKQYRIFHGIYQGDANSGLFMIGDPKQAIYSFRGADIFTYMQARHDTDAVTGHFTLDTNYRSHTSLVHGVNAIFEKASAPFIYKDEIAFYAVHPAGDDGAADKKPLLIEGNQPCPLVCWHVPITDENKYGSTIPKTWSAGHVARGCAAEISHLLNLGQQGKAKVGERHLAAHDIAVLVRDRFEAANIRNALTELGIASVYISRDSVFQTDEARDLAHLLRAVAEPTSGTQLRTAMATRLLGLSAREIHELYHDELAWEEKVKIFQDYLKIWNKHGFMPMFHSLLRREGVIARLLSYVDGDRRMTNLLQLAELAQVATLNQPGVENLLRWLDDERSDPDGNSDDQQLRMESDEDLVQIVTIHKSKGLEYSIVFLPFIWGSREVKDTRVLTYHDEANRSRIADLGTDQKGEALALADKERLAEDLRLLYVALTRAKYRCYFSWGKFNGAANSALGYLLHQEADEASGGVRCNMEGLDDAAILKGLQALNTPEDTFIEIEELPDMGAPYTPSAESKKRPEPLTFSGNTQQQWRMTSFSGLTMDSSHHHEYRVELPDHDQAMGEGRQESAQMPTLSPFTFPRGAQVGLFLHHLFENIDFPTAAGDALTTVVRKSLEQYGIESKWLDVVASWVTAILDTPLDEENALSLRAIADAKRLVEMEFHFPLNGMSARGLNAILAQSRGEGRRGAALDFSAMTGLMKGFIDLIFEHDGRFYVLDYKSNHLGHQYEDYPVERLTRAMDDHNYDLQYLIYTLALHRYLKNRVLEYDYEKHIGGVYYLFLRGMNPENGNSTGVFFDKPSFELIDALDKLFSGEQEVQHA